MAKAKKTYTVNSEIITVNDTFPTIWEAKEGIRKAVTEQKPDMNEDRQLGTIDGYLKDAKVSETPFRAETKTLKYGRTHKIEVAPAAPAVVDGQEEEEIISFMEPTDTKEVAE